jgi:rhodanese-related sulfurtransferase
VVTVRPPGARTIEEILADARARLVRLTPQDAYRELAGEGVLVDIRPAAQRADEGEIPGSAIIERNHLEWRLDPSCDARLPWVTGYDHRIIVICQEGYTSSLAAAALHDLGLHQATDVVGGFRAWTAAGLPSAPAGVGPVTLAPRRRPGPIAGLSCLSPRLVPAYRRPWSRVQLGEAVPGQVDQVAATSSSLGLRRRATTGR